MNDFRYRRVLILQAVLLIGWGLFLNETIHDFLKKGDVSRLWSSYWFLWIGFIIVNIVFLKYAALPSKKVMQALNPSTSPEDMTWSMIEETIRKKDQDLADLKSAFELENLKYKTILDSLLDPVFIYDRDLNITFSNKAFQQLFKFIPSAGGSPLIEVTRQLDFQEILLQAQRDDVPYKASFFSFSHYPDPHKSYFECKIFSVKELDGHLCLMNDITQKKMADIMREDFVSNFSHELRTPLTILNGQLQSLKTTLKQDTPEIKNIFDRIDNNSRRLLKLFNDLLQLTSVENRLELVKEDIDINQLVEPLLMEVGDNYRAKKISYELNIQHSRFWVDYNLFEQVLLNLIDNAFKYSPDGHHIKVSTRQEDSFAVLEIENSGISIHEDQLHRLFERFFRVDAARTENPGTGLGLAIVKHIVQKHEGKVKASSVSGKTTVFTIWLPLN